MSENIERYRLEADYIRTAALIAAERHYAAETPWYQAVYYLGLPSSILSTIVGAAAFARLTSNPEIAGHNAIIFVGTLSLLSAVLSSLMTYFDPTKRASAHHTTAKDYEVLYHEVGYFRRVDLHDDDLDIRKASEALKALATRFNRLNAASPVIPGRAYRAAERKLKRGRGEVIRDPEDMPLPKATAPVHNSGIPSHAPTA